MFPKRGEIYLVNFDPTLGAEIRKTRPAVVIQNDISNHYSPITIIAAITSKFDTPPYPTDVILESKESGLAVRSAIVLNQIRSVGQAAANQAHRQSGFRLHAKSRKGA